MSNKASSELLANAPGSSLQDVIKTVNQSDVLQDVPMIKAHQAYAVTQSTRMNLGQDHELTLLPLPSECKLFPILLSTGG